MTKEIETITLDNGTEATFHKEDIDENKVAKYKAVCSGRAMGSAPHFSVGQALLNAIAETKPELVIGKLVTEVAGKEGEEPTQVTTDVLDSGSIAQEILNHYITSNDLKIEKVRVAGNRTGAKKELDATKEALNSITDPAVIEALKAAGVNL